MHNKICSISTQTDLCEIRVSRRFCRLRGAPDCQTYLCFVDLGCRTAIGCDEPGLPNGLG
jgi:hypothetical protein